MNTSKLYPPPLWGACLQRMLLLSVIVAFCTMQGCATVAPDDLSQNIYKADVASTEAMLLATDLRTQGLISDGDWPQVKQGLKEARLKIAEAWKAYDADPNAAAKSYSTAQGLLEQVGTLVPALQNTLPK